MNVIILNGLEMESLDEDPEPLQDIVDDLFRKSDEVVHRIFNQILEAL